MFDSSNRSIWWVPAMILLDQLSKWWVASSMSIGDSIPVIGTFFQITSHRNRGAAFGILQNQRWFFIAFTLVVLIALGIWWWRSRRTGPQLQTASLAVMIGGAIGNWLDRARTGEVVDFFHFTFKWDLGSWHVDYVFPLFNVADSAIVVGAILLCIAQIFLTAKESPAEQVEGNAG